MNALILTEGSQSWGMGHIHRCDAFSQLLEENQISVRWMIKADKDVQHILMSSGIRNWEISDWTQREKTHDLIDSFDFLIVDSYHFDSVTANHISTFAKRILWIDDFARLRYPKGFILSPMGTAFQPAISNISVNCVLLCGIQYQPLRNAFSVPFCRTFPEKVRNVLVILGGTDIRGLASRVLEQTNARFPDAAIRFVTSRAQTDTPFAPSITPGYSIYHALDQFAIRDLMSTSDLCISASGQTLFEACSMGLPTIAVGVADNQKYNIEILSKLNAISFAGWYNEDGLIAQLDSNLIKFSDRFFREKLGSVAQKYIDGQGVRRVLQKTGVIE